MIGKTVNEMLDHFECPPGFESSAAAGLKLKAVFADEIFFVGRTAIAVEATYAKTFERGNKEFQSTIGKHW